MSKKYLCLYIKTENALVTKTNVMSNSTKSSEKGDLVLHNVYFEGKVQSLGLETEKGHATIGVMKKGTYHFNSASAETIIIISGTMKTSLNGEEWREYQKPDTFLIAPNTTFEVLCEGDVAYICYYG
jgi:uncharacterized protein YaiE (UPF0345 family)